MRQHPHECGPSSPNPNDTQHERAYEYAHVPGQRWSGGYGGDAGPGRAFPGNDFCAPDEPDRGPHFGKGPKGFRRSDERMREDVCDAIAHLRFVNACDVEVTVEAGIVVLTGTVEDRSEKRAIEEASLRCRGVEDVHNEIRLRRHESLR
jgi:hypothetical protein